MGTLIEYPKFQAVDSLGAPLSGGLLYTYVAGSASTPLTTYSDYACTVPNANPIVLNSRGEMPLSTGLYATADLKLVLKTSAGVEVWTMDNIKGPVTTSTAVARKNMIINGLGAVFQGSAYTLAKDVYGEGPDEFSGMATGTLVTAGTLTQLTSANCGRTGYAFHFSGVTLTGTGIIYLRYRMVSKDAKGFKNQTASFSSKVYHDKGSDVNYTVYVRKPTVEDDFTAVTEISNSGAQTIISSAEADLKFEDISMGDCSYGIEIEIKVACGAITTKNFQFTELQFEISSVATSYDFSKFYREEIIAAGSDTTKFLRGDQTWTLPTVLNGYINGLTLSNNGTDALNDIDIAAGMATDSTNAYLMTLSSALTKRLDAAWAVGTNQGGLDTGSEGVSTWYHVWLIRKDSDGTIDVLFSASATAPTMPAGWTYKRRIGAVRNDASSNILAFSQLDDEFLLSVSILDVNVTIAVTTAVLYVLTVPLGIKIHALLRMAYSYAGTGYMVLISSPDESDQAPSITVAPLGDGYTVSGPIGILNLKRRTNISGQIRTRSNTGGEVLKIATYGWIDGRGKY